MDNNGLEVISLYYDHRENVITYQTGEYADDIISKLISPEKLQRLKQFGGVEYIDYCGSVYELDFPVPDEEETTTLYYDPQYNRIEDNDGYIMFNIFSIISPQDLMLFKQKKEDMLIRGKNGNRVELIYNKY